MLKVDKITKSSDFNVLKKKGQKFTYHPFILLFIKDGSLKRSKIGIIVSSKIGNAVIRNKTKRRLRCISMDVLKEEKAHGFSVCIIARYAASDFNYEKMRGLFVHAVKRIMV